MSALQNALFNMDPMEVLKAKTTSYPDPSMPTKLPHYHPIEYQVASDDGARTLWVVFAIMLISTGMFTVLSWNVPVQRRLYYVVTTLITTFASISYFGMASGTGIAQHCLKTKVHGSEVIDGWIKESTKEVCREVYWARYVDWSVTTPLLLLDLCLLAGIDGAHTIMAIVADVAMILTGLFAAFGNEGTVQKWGWYTIACAAYAVVIWHVALHGSRMVTNKSAKVVQLFGSLAAFTFLLWTAYPVVWGITDGGRKASVDAEIMAYAVLDVLAKPVFGAWLLLSHRSVPETNVELNGYWSQGLGSDGRIRIGDDD
jgi:bacteriorhodopsin